MKLPSSYPLDRSLNSFEILGILWRISASRWMNRWHHWRSLFTGKGEKGKTKATFAGFVFSGFLILMLFATGFFLANTALIAPADEVAYVTDDQGKEIVEHATYVGFLKADQQLEQVRFFPTGPVRKAVEDRWMAYAHELATLEAGQRIMTDDQQVSYSHKLVELFRTRGIEGFAYWHNGFTGLNEPLWPRTETGRVLFGQIMGFTFCLIPLILLFLHLGVTSRELGQVDWSFEWLFSFPVPARTLFFGRILSWTANPTIWFFVFPFVWLVFVAAGLRWWSPWAGILATMYLALFSGSLAVLAEVILRKFLSLAQIKNVQALCTIIGGCLLLLYFTFSASRLVASDLTMLLGKIRLPLFTLPPAFPIAAVLPGNSSESLLAAIVGMVAVAVGLPWLSTLACEALTLDGLVKTISSQKSSPVRRRVKGNEPIIAQKSWWMFLPGSEIWTLELRLLARDRNLLTQVLICPLIIVAYYLLSHVSVVAAATSYFRHAAALTYGVSAYILLNSAFPLLGREQKTLWLIGALPRDLISILWAKVAGWVLFSCCYAGCFLVGLALMQDKFQFSMLEDGLVTLIGVALCGFLAGGIGVLGTDISGQEIKMRPDLVYFYLILASLFMGAIYSEQLSLRGVQILLTGGVVWAIWQRVEQSVPYLLDPFARPAQQLELLDAFTPILIYFVAYQAVLSLLFHSLLLPINAPATQMWTVLVAGLLAAGSSLITLLLNRVTDLNTALYFSWVNQPGTRSWGTVSGTLTILIMLAATYYKIVPVLPFVDSNHASNGSLLPIAPAWLRCDNELCLLPWFVVGAPLLQGYLFRSLLLGRLSKMFSFTGALSLSSAVYMFVQSSTLTTAFPTLLVGLAAGYVLLVTRRSYLSMIMHSLFNAAMIWLFGVTAGV